MQIAVQLQVQVPTGTPDEQADHIGALLAKLDADVTVTADMREEDEERTIENALRYFKRAWPRNFPHLKRLHDELVGLGYEPRLPESKPDSRNKYPYIRYVRADGATLGSANSGSFIFWGKDNQEQLGGEEGARVTRDGVRFELTDDTVSVVLSLTVAIFGRGDDES